MPKFSALPQQLIKIHVSQDIAIARHPEAFEIHSGIGRSFDFRFDDQADANEIDQ